jgi:release factor glutamine methyltransferase
LAREWPQARLVAIDVSAAALTVAAANLARHSVADRVALVRADIRDVAFAEPFDLIVANPPYVPTAALDRLQPEVAGWEPRLALDGGTDGLDAVRLLLNRAPDLLRPGGALLVEIAGDQAGEVVALARAGGRFEDVEVTPDYSGLPRLVSARLHEPRWVSERRP